MRRGIWSLLSAAALALATTASSAETFSPADAIAEKFANADKPKPQEIANSERPNLDYEMEMLRRARLEAEERKAADGLNPSSAALPAATIKPATLEASPPQAPPSTTAPMPEAKLEPITVEPPPLAPLSNAPVEATPAPAKQIEPEQDRVQALKSPATADPAPQTPSPPVTAASATARATILLVLEGARPKVSPDPILCFGDVCAISSGLSSPARAMPRGEALALKSTRDVTSDPCFGKSACAFRDVPLPDDAILQVISIGAGDPPKAGDGFTADLDVTCKVEDRELSCGQPLATLHFTAWVVPEATAASAGPPALEAAIADGLPFADDILSADK
jgi:hypothetical protein